MIMADYKFEILPFGGKGMNGLERSKLMKLKNRNNFGRDYKDERLFFFLLWCGGMRQRGHGDVWVIRQKHPQNQYPAPAISLNRLDANFYWVEKWSRSR